MIDSDFYVFNTRQTYNRGAQAVYTVPRMFQNYWPAAQLGPLHNQVCHMNLRLWFISRHTYVVFVRKHLHAIII